jgi:hypothetical protein
MLPAKRARLEDGTAAAALGATAADPTSLPLPADVAAAVAPVLAGSWFRLGTTSWLVPSTESRVGLSWFRD